MHSGRKFFLKDHDPAQWHIPDIARNLSGLHRYTGGSRFSVAQHEVIGARMADRFYPEAPLLGARFMVHDIAESSYGDVSSPLKRCIPEYCALLANADASVEKRMGITFLDDPLVKELDLRMWLSERRLVFREAADRGIDMTEDYRGPLKPFDLDDDEHRELFTPWSPDYAEDVWLTELYERLPWIR